MALNTFKESITLEKPVLMDGNGKELYTFQSATVLQFRSGEAELQTEPTSLPAEFPFSSYSGRHSVPLYLGDDDRTLPVTVVGGMLVIASSNIERHDPRKG